jgi:hypothetical protein
VPVWRLTSSHPRLLRTQGVGLLKTLHDGDYNVTVVAPQNYSLFVRTLPSIGHRSRLLRCWTTSCWHAFGTFAQTPLLPSATVGTVEVRSLVEPLRRTLARLRGGFIQAKAIDLAMEDRLLEIETPSGEHVYVPYDRLVIACGSSSNTHGVPGLEHCFQLKTIPDAQAIRRRIIDNLELASLPTTTPEERKRLLSLCVLWALRLRRTAVRALTFDDPASLSLSVVCGGGPTGVEFAAELVDLFNEDAFAYFPKLLRSQLSVSIVQSRDHILNTYSEKISQYAEKRFAREDMRVVTSASASLSTAASALPDPLARPRGLLLFRRPCPEGQRGLGDCLDQGP